MKRIIITIVIVFGGLNLFAQTPWDDLDFSTFRHENKQVPRHNYNDEFYDYVTGASDPQLYQKVNDAVNKAPNGVRIETSPYSTTSSSSRHVSQQQAQQMKKAQYEANHRAWQEQRRAQQAQAAEEARIRKEREEQRKREDKQRRYVQARDMDLQISAGHYQRQHNQITYNVTEGYERTMKYQPEGSQQLQSQYIPSSDKPTYDIAAIISKSGGGTPVSLAQPISSLRIQYTDYELERLKSWKIVKPQNSKIPDDNKNGKIWDEMRSKLDESQIQGIAYAMKATNVISVEVIDSLGNITTVKQGMLPTAMGINNKGNYVFEAISNPYCINEEHFDRIYEVSPNGVLTYITLDEHFFDDENIIKMIREGRFNDELFNSLKINNLIKIEGGATSWKDLKGASPEKLKNLLPQIKAVFKMNLFDNSSTVKGKVVYYVPESSNMNLVFQLKDPTHSTLFGGFGGEVSAGGKGEVKISYGTNKWFTKPPQKKAEDDKESDHWLPEMKAGVTTTEAKAYIEGGSIKKVGNQFIQCTGTAQVKGSVELDYITVTTLNPFRGNGTVGWSCKIITTPTDQFPTNNNK